MLLLKENVNDNFNGRNNLITVNESDFDVTEALIKDETAEREHSSSVNSLTSKFCSLLFTCSLPIGVANIKSLLFGNCSLLRYTLIWNI